MEYVCLAILIGALLAVVFNALDAMDIQSFEYTNGPVICMSVKEYETLKHFMQDDVYLRVSYETGWTTKRQGECYFKAPAYFLSVDEPTRFKILRRAGRFHGLQITRLVEVCPVA
jgi:hypothetical protein